MRRLKAFATPLPNVQRQKSRRSWQLRNTCRCTTRSPQPRAAGSWLIGPNTLGIYVPGRGLLGSIAPSFCKPGRLAVIIRSGTLALAVSRQLTLAGIGQRIVAHVGGDSVIGRNPHEYLQALAGDDETAAVLYCGEIGGDKEYAFAEAVRGFAKPIYAMVVGRYAPAQKQMGHAGALIGSD